MAISKESQRQKIRYRIRKKISGTGLRPRLSVYRSNKYIYCQLIDDDAQATLATASSREENLETKGTKTDQAKQVGILLASRAKAKDIHEVVFDRGGYLYHGRVKAIAEGAREGGLKF